MFQSVKIESGCLINVKPNEWYEIIEVLIYNSIPFFLCKCLGANNTYSWEIGDVDHYLTVEEMRIILDFDIYPQRIPSWLKCKSVKDACREDKFGKIKDLKGNDEKIY